MVDIDTVAVGAYLASRIEGLRLPVTARRFGDGQSNPTYRLTDDTGRDFVLRRKPFGKLLASAHAIEREYRVMKALRSTDVPVPAMHCLCEDTSIIGAAFYVMSFVEGRIFWDPALPELEATDRRRLYDDINRVISALHSVDVGAVGLDEYGKTGDFLQRQVARWTRQYRASETDPIAAMDRLIEWLPRHVPPGQPTTIFHGDLRIDNMIVDPNGPRVVAVLDWELSTLGDPLADLAYHALPWSLRSDQFRGMAEKDLPTLGVPTESEYLNAYCRRAGRPGIEPAAWDFYRAYALFRLAAILQGILKRAEEGNASSENAVKTGSKARSIAEYAWRTIEKSPAT